MTSSNKYRLFPTLDYNKVAKVDLNLAAKTWYQLHPDNPELLLRPPGQTALIKDLHSRLGIEWSYGSYLENRSTLLKGSYLDSSSNYLHLGIDCNVEFNTPLAATFDFKIRVIDDDKCQNWGWGPRIIVEPLNGQDQPLMIYAHLNTPNLKVDEVINKGQTFATIGAPPSNGNWFPHLHLQAISRQKFKTLISAGIEALDGYGNPGQIDSLSKDFPDPEYALGLY